MPIDWDKFEKNLGKIVDKSAEKTDRKLAGEIASLTRMTEDEIVSLFPKNKDIEQFADLIKVVKSAEDRNRRINNIVANSEKFGSTILSLLEKFI